MSAVKLNQQTRTVHICNLAVENGEFFNHVVAAREAEREQAVLQVIGLGTTAVSLLRTGVEVEFVEKHFAKFAARAQTLLDEFERRAVDEMTRRFSPTESGSYTKQLSEVLASGKKDLEFKAKEFSELSRNLLDPDKRTSAVGKLADLIAKAEREFAEMFDPNRKGSYAARLQEHLEKLFGSDGRPGQLQKVVADGVKPVLDELRTLREKFAVHDAARKIAQVTTLKGYEFEEEVECRLSDAARPYGDIVQRVGTTPAGAKSGDFVVDLNGSGRRLVVEARDRKGLSAPVIKQDLKRAMTARSADFGMLVARDASALPQYVGRFQMYDHQIVTDLDTLDIAYRVARVSLESETLDEQSVDVTSVRAKLNAIKDAVQKERAIRSKSTQVENLAGDIKREAAAIADNVVSLVREIELLLQRPDNENGES